MAQFLKQIGSKIPLKIYEELAVFIVLYRKALNEHGYAFLDETVTKTTEEFCEVQNGKFAPYVAEDLIKNILPKLHKIVNTKQIKLIGTTGDQVRNVINFTKIFGYWLLANDYTNSYLEICYEGYKAGQNDFKY